MKRLLLVILALGFLALAGCKRDITFNVGGGITPAPANVSVDKNRGDVVVFINKDDRVHRIHVGTGPIPAGAGTTIYPPGSGAGRPDTYTWSIPAATAPPATATWTCLIHTGESGTITINP
jgi:plastocyanin